MYDFVEGRLAEQGPTRLVVDVSGVGYELTVPLGSGFEPSEGRVKAWTHLVVRDDAHLLFGFARPEQRAIFRLLLSAKGVGPSAALAILSQLGGQETLEAIAGQDMKPFLRVKGVGKKTAEQILLDLREKAPRLLAAGEHGTLVPQAPPAAPGVEDAVRALVSIGYSEKEARKNVERAAARLGEADLEELVRAALRE